MRYGSGGVSKLDYGRYLAASLVYLMLGQRNSVGLVLFDDHVRKFVCDSSNPGHRLELIDALEHIRPRARPTSARCSTTWSARCDAAG